ncbi:unnamed protein product [Dovyalis caffra]|uniref:Uncharacterized protein n=1 Tax=Dovyalis caffra TaxID=77055 RepID=A0AAV1SL25_9ROSI|nr:unnamed protein product [Dovyalis caffra]
MGVLVVNPQDCLKNPLQQQPTRMRFPRNPNPSNPRPNKAQPNRRKRNTNSSPPPRAAAPKNNNNNNNNRSSNLVMGQVKILKRGEEDLLKPTKKVETPKGIPIPKAVKSGDLGLGSTSRLGPDPVLVPTHVRLTESKDFVNGFYAGSAFFTSPPPSSLPLPGFFTKKANDPVAVDAGRHGFKEDLGDPTCLKGKCCIQGEFGIGFPLLGHGLKEDLGS